MLKVTQQVQHQAQTRLAYVSALLSEADMFAIYANVPHLY